MNRFLAVGVCLICFSGVAGADVIYLNNGQKITVQDAVEDGLYIRCIRFGAEVSYLKENVARVEYEETAAPAPAAVRKPAAPVVDVEAEQRRAEARAELDALLAREENLYLEPPADYEQTIKNHLNRILVDPYSIQELEIRQPVRKLLHHAIPSKYLVVGQVVWFSIVTYNAKNSYGGYVGKKDYTYIFRGDEIVDVKAMP